MNKKDWIIYIVVMSLAIGFTFGYFFDDIFISEVEIETYNEINQTIEDIRNESDSIKPFLIIEESPEQIEDIQEELEYTKEELKETNLGLFNITIYTPYCDGGKWGYQTATGVTSEHILTCAVDPKVIPLGSIIKIGEFTLQAVDTGSAVKGKVIDIFYDGSVKDAEEWIKNFGTSKEVILIEQ